MSETTETRDAFEAWARETFVLDWNRGFEVYTNSHTDAAFQAWCAAKVRADSSRALAAAQSELAAARREVETAQAEARLRGETIDALRREVAGWERRTKELGSVVLRAWEVLRGWWQFSKLEERDEPFADALARAITADREHDAYALGEMQRLNAVIETVTRERDKAKQWAQIESVHSREMLTALNASRAALEDVRKEVKTVTCWAKAAEADLATSRAALEDVRRVDECSGTVFRDEHGEWTRTPDMCDECDPGPITSADFEGGYFSPECDNEEAHKITRAYSIAALGRALAQEAGDGKV